MLIKQLVGILEGKFKKESASEIFTRYESLKKSNANPELLAKVLAQAEDLMTSEVKDKMRTMDSKYSGEDWWETVKTFYKVEERNHEWAVISDAKDWHEQKEWVYPTKYEADEQLLKLIGYKVADRKAGKGSEDKDFERAAMLAKRREPAMAEGVVTEGSWAMASTPEEITKLKNILSKPLRAKNASKVLYNLIGDDSLFDQIDEVKSTDPEDDVKQMVLIWLKKNVPSLYKAVYHAKVAEGAGLSPYELGHKYALNSVDRLIRKPRWAKGTKEYAEYEKGLADGDKGRISILKQQGVPVKESLMSEMVRLIPRGYLNEAAPAFKGYDVHHNPDGVMVQVMGSDEDAPDDYYGISVVFGKLGTRPKLVTSDDLADRQAAKYKAQIIAAAEKRLGKAEKDHLASL